MESVYADALGPGRYAPRLRISVFACNRRRDGQPDNRLLLSGFCTRYRLTALGLLVNSFRRDRRSSKHLP